MSSWIILRCNNSLLATVFNWEYGFGGNQMNSKLDGPLTSAFESDITDVIMQEFITYRKRDGMIVKETTNRKFNSDGTDYYDCSTVQPLGHAFAQISVDPDGSFDS